MITEIRQLYEIVARLEARYPGRKFTPDGHLVGSIGEVLAAERYGLTLTPHSTEACDAYDSEGRAVEIKCTQGSAVAFNSHELPKRVIVVKLHKDGSISEFYNGPSRPVAQALSRVKQQKNGQRRLSLSKLQQLLTR